MYYYGKNTVKNLLKKEEVIKQVYLSKKFKDYDILRLLKHKKITPTLVDERKLDTLSNDGNHQGVIIETPDYQYKELNHVLKKNKDNENALFIILDGIEDPQNFGSIIRTGAALNTSGIIIPKNRSAKITPTVAKVSTGAINDIDIVRVTNLKQTIKTLKDDGYWIVGAHMDTDLLYDEVDYKMKIGLVIGSEGKGLSNNILSECDYIVKLPMYQAVSSLNAAVSTAILLYQIDSNRRH